MSSRKDRNLKPREANSNFDVVIRNGTVYEDERLLPLTTAIRSMTSLPAEKFKIKDRGKIETGAVADVAVFNLSAINDRATYLAPHQYAEGLVHLFVAGVQVVENGQATGRRGGRALKRT